MSKRREGRPWPTDKQTRAIEASMNRQSRLTKLRRKAFRAAEWLKEQLE